MASNTEKEVLEEAGIAVRAERVIAVQNWRRHNRVNSLYGVIKIFMLCEYEQGSFKENIETTESGFLISTVCLLSLPWKRRQESRSLCALIFINIQTIRQLLIE